MMKRLLLGCWLATMATSAWAQYCTVTDPTGTPLNVRVQPNGPILGALHNGTTVQVLQTTVDASGRPWVFVAPQEAGKNGWVFGAYLTCGR
jgi:uncharacterized protein YraI